MIDLLFALASVAICTAVVVSLFGLLGTVARYRSCRRRHPTAERGDVWRHARR